MGSKTPGTDVWDLALRSQKLWQLLADNIQDQGSDPLEELGWKNTGIDHLYAQLLIHIVVPTSDYMSRGSYLFPTLQVHICTTII